MTDKKPLTGEVIPFGKHKGTPVEVLQETDPKYLEWLAQQDWFRQKYGTIYQIIINHGTEPAETPEHNALQLKFLDLEFKRAAWMLACDTDRVPKQIHATFEENGIDVLLAAEDHHAAIELKPIMGDDYPAVVRQVRGYKQAIKRLGNYDPSLSVVVGSFQSAVATLDQLQELFKDISFLTVEQIENYKRWVPEGIARQKYQDAVMRHAWLERARAYVESSQHIDDLQRSHLALSMEDERAILEAVAACGAEPKWTPEGKSRDEWRKERRAALELAIAEQLALAHGAMVKAKEALAALGGEP